MSFTLYCDGGSRGNPGISGCGCVLYSNDSVPGKEESKKVWEKAQYCGIGTNNEAEYLGLVLGLRQCVEMKVQNLTVKMDSLLVINQMKKEWKLKAQNLKPYNAKACFYASKIPKIKFEHVRRELNTEADEQSNIGMDNISNIKTPLNVLDNL